MIDIFFCKQKTAYEMRISDWSSDVCSSDLHTSVMRSQEEIREKRTKRPGTQPSITEIKDRRYFLFIAIELISWITLLLLFCFSKRKRSKKKAELRCEEQRVGKEYICTCRLRWSTSISKKKEYNIYKV